MYKRFTPVVQDSHIIHSNYDEMSIFQDGLLRFPPMNLYIHFDKRCHIFLLIKVIACLKHDDYQLMNCQLFC